MYASKIVRSWLLGAVSASCGYRIDLDWAQERAPSKLRVRDCLGLVWSCRPSRVWRRFPHRWMDWSCKSPFPGFARVRWALTTPRVLPPRPTMSLSSPEFRSASQTSSSHQTTVNVFGSGETTARAGQSTKHTTQSHIAGIAS